MDRNQKFPKRPVLFELNWFEYYISKQTTKMTNYHWWPNITIVSVQSKSQRLCEVSKTNFVDNCLSTSSYVKLKARLNAFSDRFV